MKNALRRRFWLETGMAIVTGILSVITLMQSVNIGIKLLEFLQLSW